MPNRERKRVPPRSKFTPDHSYYLLTVHFISTSFKVPSWPLLLFIDCLLYFHHVQSSLLTTHTIYWLCNLFPPRSKFPPDHSYYLLTVYCISITFKVLSWPLILFIDCVLHFYHVQSLSWPLVLFIDCVLYFHHVQSSPLTTRTIYWLCTSFLPRSKFPPDPSYYFLTVYFISTSFKFPSWSLVLFIDCVLYFHHV